MKRMVISVGLFCLLASPVVLAAGEYHNKVLNNLVTELMNVREPELTGKQKIDFMNPRHGWCYFAVSGKATVRLNDELEPLVAGKAAGESAEAIAAPGTREQLVATAVEALMEAKEKQRGSNWQ